MISYEDKLARLVCNYSLELKENDFVLIRGEMCAQPLISACFKEVLRLGAHPLIRMSIPEQNALFFKYGSEHQFSYTSPVDTTQAETITAQIAIESTDNSKQLTNADPSMVAKYQKVRGDLREISTAREDQGLFRWIIAPYPTAAMAQDAEMSLEEYTNFVYSACKLDEDDPVTAWQKIDKMLDSIVKRLTGVKNIHIKGKNTDLTLNVDGRIWRNCSGQRNMPDGEVFTSPVENSANGTIMFDVPTNYNGIEAKNVFLRLEKGRVVESRAEKGGDYLLKMLDIDDGARFVGEIAFGMNNSIQKPSKNILFDEKIGQSIHMAVGASYSEAGGVNKSALHWDLIKNMRSGCSVEADGKLIYKDGEFI